jgi:hypothetical protein
MPSSRYASWALLIGTTPPIGAGQMKRPRSRRLMYSDIPRPSTHSTFSRCPLAAKDEEIAAVCGEIQHLLHLQSQAVHAAPHIGRDARQPYPPPPPPATTASAPLQNVQDPPQR